MKRAIMLIITILWYIAVIAFVVGFVKQLIGGYFANNLGEAIGRILINLLGTILLCVAQIIIVTIVAKMYDDESYWHLGKINILGIIFSPLLLIWSFFATLRTLWRLIRYKP